MKTYYLSLIYLFLPYLLRVTLLANGEYKYESIYFL